MKKIPPKAQVLIEYVVIAILVMTGILIAGPYVVRSINAFFKASSSQVKDSMNEQIRQGPLVPNPPTCRPVCRSKRCGADDGCGGICTECPDPQVCRERTPGDYWCCDPNCHNDCGTTECGDPCPGCPPGDVCDASTNYFCCTPDCNNKTCGDNGCGTPCQPCPGGDVCTTIGCPAPLLDCCCHADCSFQPGYCGEICGGIVCQCTNPGEICGPGFVCTTCPNGVCDPGEDYVSCPQDCPAGTFVLYRYATCHANAYCISDSPNPITGGCSCPPGYGAVLTSLNCACSSGCNEACSHFECRFGMGGSYILYRGAQCHTPNPTTGSCSCPPGTSPVNIGGSGSCSSGCNEACSFWNCE